MKMKRIITLAFLLPFLVGCGNQTYAGEYVFQMGKTKDTHMAVDLKLLDAIYDETNPEKGKKFELDLDINMNNGEQSEGGESGGGIIEIISELTPITGYYSVNVEEKIYEESRLNIGVNLLGSIEIPQSLTDLIFVANINSTLVNFFLPVSTQDLIFQLYWYGYDSKVSDITDPSKDPITSPDGAHPVGTHPTEEDIKQINTHYAADHDGVSFRDYHVLKLGLTKK